MAFLLTQNIDCNFNNLKTMFFKLHSGMIGVYVIISFTEIG